MCSDGKSSVASSFTLGTVLGVGLGVLLSTKKGKKIVKQAWKQIEPYVDDAVSNAKVELDNAKEVGEDFLKDHEAEIDQKFSRVKAAVSESLPMVSRKPTKKTFFKGV